MDRKQGKAMMSFRFGMAAALAACTVLGGLGVAHADDITVKGKTLEGKVIGLTPVVLDEETTVSGLAFETDYGKGNLLVPFADIEKLDTKAEFHVIHGEDTETVGRLVGVVGKDLEIEQAGGGKKNIAIADIVSILSSEKYEGSTLAGLRSRYRFWTGTFDAGYSLTQATIDQQGFNLGLAAERNKAPTRFTMFLGSRLGSQKQKGESSERTEDLYRGGAKLEYDLTPQWFAYGAGDAVYDGIQRLSVRGIPQLGVGYRFWKTAQSFLQAQVGGAWVFEKYFGGDSNDSPSLAIGAEYGAKLWYGSRFHWTWDYLPALDDFTGDYLTRTEASLLVPLYDFLNVKLGVGDVYDSTPAEDTDNNRFYTTIGLGLVF